VFLRGFYPSPCCCSTRRVRLLLCISPQSPFSRLWMSAKGNLV
jgi:hypothetical protein